MKRQSLVGVLAVIACTCAQAQATKAASNTHIPNMAMISPDYTRQVLQKLIGMCAAYGNAVQQSGSQAFSGWMARHQVLLDESLRVRQEFLGPKPSEDTKRTLEMLDAMTPMIVDGQFDSNAKSINGQPTPEAKANLCMAYMKSIDQDSWELRRSDPETFKFLQDRIDARSSATSASKLKR